MKLKDLYKFLCTCTIKQLFNILNTVFLQVS
jgi:hypothetical protein